MTETQPQARAPVVDTDEGGGIFSGRYAPVTIAVLTTIALAAFDALAVVAALPEIGADLGNVGLLPWVVTGFLVTSTIAVVVAGPVIDAFGVRATFRVTTVAFVAASVACAAAPSLPLLVAGRFVQGLGGGLVVAVCFAAVGVSYPNRLTARAFAAESAVWGLAGFGGPALASVLVTHLGWPSVFLVNLPLGLVAGIFGWRAFPEKVEGAAALRVDGRGIALLASFVVVTLVGVSQVHWWSVLAVAVAAVLFWRYWRHSGDHPDPVLARRHVASRPYGAFNIAAFVVLAAGLGSDTYLPLYLRSSRGASTSAAAFAVIWLTTGWTLGSFLTSWVIDRVGPRRLVWGGLLLEMASLGASLVFVLQEAPTSFIFASYVFTGLAIGVVSSTVLTLVQRASPPVEIGRANAAHQFARNLGITLGVAVGGAALLFTVDGRVDDVEAVRELLAGEEDVQVDAETGDAVAAGFVASHAVSVVVLGAGGAVAFARRRSFEWGPGDQPPG